MRTHSARKREKKEKGVYLGSIGFIMRAVPPDFPSPELDGFLDIWELLDRESFCLRPLGDRCELCLEPIEFLLPSEVDSASPKHLIRTSTFPPSGVNFRLLLTRLIMTWRILCWSPQRHMSFNRPVPCGPRAGSLVLFPSVVSNSGSAPMNLTAKAILPSSTCLWKIVCTWVLISINLNSFSSRLSCWPIWFLLNKLAFIS